MMHYLSLVFIIALSMGCSTQDKGTQAVESSFILPQDAIQVKQDLYYLPIGRDADGCMQYQAYARHAVTVQVIIYQNAAGVFSTSKNKNTCL